jgi:hypothetical protein
MHIHTSIQADKTNGILKLLSVFGKESDRIQSVADEDL